MSVRYRVVHRTTYEYGQPVSVCHNLFHLRPRAVEAQSNEPTTLTVTPAPAVLADRLDYFGNPTTFAIVQQLHRRLDVEATTVITRAPAAAVPARDGDAWEVVRDRLRTARDPEQLVPYQMTFPSPMIRGSETLRAHAAASFPADRPLLDAAMALSSRLHAELTYVPGATTVETPPEETLAAGRGVCQDFAHVFIGCLRALGLPARYVSGYLVTDRRRDDDGPELVGADASHAWVAVWTPEAGWVDLDPTNDVIPGERHLTVAWGRDYGDVCPVKGVILGGGAHTVRVGVDVRTV